MTAFKMPIDPLTGPIRDLISGLSVLSDVPSGEITSFDFRSHRFAMDALTLARVSGCSLVACRQQLFMAEGDMGLAHELLVSGYDAEPATPRLH